MMKNQLYIATIGKDFEPGILEALKASGEKAIKRGIKVTIDPIGNKCVQPYHGLALMRNWAIIRAIQASASHVLITDCDILFDNHETITKLVEADRDAIVPFWDQRQLPTQFTLMEPSGENDGGVHPIIWSIMSCVLFKTTVFTKHVGARLFSDYMAIDEDRYYWDLLRIHGITPYQHMGAPVTLLKPPTPMWAKDKGTILREDNAGSIKLHYQRPPVESLMATYRNEV